MNFQLQANNCGIVSIGVVNNAAPYIIYNSSHLTEKQKSIHFENK